MIKKCLWIGTFCFLLFPIIGQTKEAAMEHQTDLIDEVVIQKGDRIQDTMNASSARLDIAHERKLSKREGTKLLIKDAQGDLILDKIYGVNLYYSEALEKDALNFDKHQISSAIFYIYNPEIWLTETEMRIWLKAITAGIEVQGWKRNKEGYPDPAYTVDNVPFQKEDSTACFEWHTNSFRLNLGIIRANVSQWMQPRTEDLFLIKMSLSVKK